MNKHLRNISVLLTLATLFANYSILEAPILREQFSKVAHAEEAQYPYTQKFGITAYYSPLPGQAKYVTGSYAGDIRLNGRGTNGADGTPVYPGMVAAPRTYDFGIKLFIPGIGMTAVHDRGGAIVVADGDDGNGPEYDRLDIWMGYGDKGLARALAWGYQKVDVTVYGIDTTIDEDVTISDFDPSEKTNQEYFYIPQYYVEDDDLPLRLFPDDLWYLDDGKKVKELQEYLEQLGYYNGDINGYFGDETRMAIYLFQKDKGLVQTIADLGAGHFGVQTRSELEDTILNRKKSLSPKMNLGPDDDDAGNVKKLQMLLRMAGYSVSESGKYDTKTVTAVFNFQKDNDIVSSQADYGAGYFGPKTSATLTKKLDDLFEAGDINIPVAHANEEVVALVNSRAVLTPFMHNNLSLGDSGPEVTRLQTELKSLSLLRKKPTGTYDETTEHAIYKFQQIHGLVAVKTDEGAGVFGPQTRLKLNEILSSKNYYNKKIAEKSVN